MRRIEERNEYPEGWADEWGPFSGHVDTYGWRDKDFREFVREFNKRQKALGNYTRIRSVEDDSSFW